MHLAEDQKTLELLFTTLDNINLADKTCILNSLEVIRESLRKVQQVRPEAVSVVLSILLLEESITQELERLSNLARIV